MNLKSILSIVLRVIAAVIMLQTLYFKFTAQPESIEIFTKVGMEPVGRIGTGVAELIASVLLLIPATIAIGALLAAGVMAGAIATHLFILGIEVRGDGGQLFIYASTVFVISIVLMVMYKDQLFRLKDSLLKKRQR